MDNVKKFYAYLEELDKSYTELADLLQRKLAAISANDLARLDNLIKDEQAYVLLSRGFDQNLKLHRERLGLKGESLSQIIPELPDAYQGDFQILYTQLKASLDKVTILNDNCQALLKDRLHQLDVIKRESEPSGNVTYQKPDDDPAPPQRQTSSLFSKSV